MTTIQFEAFERLAAVILRLGRVQRITEDADGHTESDTTHSVMLALACGAIAQETGMRIDRVVGLALIHDIAEAYAGDTPTLQHLTPEQASDKRAREAAGLARVRVELATLPWVIGLIDEYEMQETPEARFVRVFDKATPKWTHTLNACAVPRREGMSREDLEARNRDQVNGLAERYDDQGIALTFLYAAGKRAVAAWPDTLETLKARAGGQ